MPDLLQPKEITLTDAEGKEHSYILSKIPAVPAREIIAKYPISALPKIGDYSINEATMFKLMKYVAVPTKNGAHLVLSTEVLINNHVPDFETLAKLEMAELEYNVSFLRAGKASTTLEGFFQKALTLISQTLTRSSGVSSPPEKPASTNSAPSTL